MFLQVSEYTNELALLAKLNQELEEEVEMRKSAHMDEIPSWRSELDDCSDERLIRTDSVSLENAPSPCFAVLHRWMEQQEAKKQMHQKEQREEYKVLLGEKTARDVEINTCRSGH